MIDYSTLNARLQEHPLNAACAGFTAAERSGAAAVAERDVLAALDGRAVPEALREQFLSAVVEQCVFLLLNPEQLTGAADGVLAEAAAGTSRRCRERTSPLCLRAAALLAPLTAGEAALKLARG